MRGASWPARPAALLVVFLHAVTQPGLAAGPEAVAGWPQFRGVMRDGSSAERGLARAWPETGPPVLWRRAAGEGFSGVVVGRDMVYLLGAEGDDEVAIGLRDRSGEEVWRTTIGPRFKEEFGDGPRSTPALSDGVLYALAAGGRLHALKASDGTRVWETNLPEKFGGRVPHRGFASSPLVDGNLLVLEAGGAEGKAFLALDRKTGATRWTAGEGRAGYSSGIVASIDGVRQFIFARTGGEEILSLLPSGEVHWRHPWKAAPIGTPLFVPPNRVFASAAEDAGAILIEVQARDGGIEAREVWSSRDMKNHFSSSVLVGGSIYGFDNATLKCIDAASGEARWAQRGFGKGSLIAADGLLLVLGDTGALAMVDATPDGYRERGRFQALTGKTWTEPALAHGRLYLRDQDEVTCLDLRPPAPAAANAAHPITRTGS